jgi:hypothetical protein
MSLNAKNEYLKINQSGLWVIYVLMSAAFLLVYLKPDLNSYILPERLWFDKNHFPFSMIAFLTGIFVFLKLKKTGEVKGNTAKILLTLLIITAISGFFMLIKFEAIEDM